MFLTLKGSSNRLSEDVQKRFAEVEVDSSWKDWLFVAEEVQHQVRVSGMSGDIGLEVVSRDVVSRKVREVVSSERCLRERGGRGRETSF